MERLERQNKRLNWGLCATVLTGLSLLLMGQNSSQDVPDVIRAKRFEVVDDQGKALVILAAGEGAGLILTFDEKGNGLVAIGAPEGGGAVATFDGKGNQKENQLVAIGATSDGTAQIATYDGKGNKLVMISAGMGRGTIATLDKERRPMTWLTSTESGRGWIGTFDDQISVEDRKGNSLVSLSGMEGSPGTVTTYDGKGSKLVALGASKDGEGRVVTYDRAGGVRAVWPTQ